jgi:hypothetical protein
MQNNAEFFFSKKEMQDHAKQFGTKGKGKSRHILSCTDTSEIVISEEQYASPESSPPIVVSDTALDTLLIALKDAYWNNSDNSKSDTIHDILASTIQITPNEEQIKSVFYLLPETIIGSIIQWGISDTVVRDTIYTFIEDNEEKVRLALDM